MRKVLFGIIIVLSILLVIQYCENNKESRQTSLESTQLIQQQIKNVGKLIVTEGHFSEVYTYKDQQNYLMDYLTFEKKALAVINAKVMISYDLHQIEYEIDEKNKVLQITKLPEEEVSINPTITFYDINQSVFNPFTGRDYNTIQQKIRKQLAQKIEKSTLKTNAKNRLVSELQKLFVVTKTMNWTLELNETPVKNITDIQIENKLLD